MQPSLYPRHRNRTEGPKAISQTVAVDEATMESWSMLATKLGISLSEAARISIRGCALQHGIPTRSAPRHPDLLVEVAP